ncbi:replication initiation protein [Clostridium sp.]|uniref:replication initiation protein n=1 Tax=Clostridium sp. TaxID=1506 RepID=UPI0026252A78|nr:replication initiation protein [Clostridium sp.]
MVTDISKVNENWIYQSNKLIEASYTFTVLEQKLIRLLASMVKKDDEDFKEYKFRAIDLSKTLNIHKKTIYKELDQITDKLMSRYIKFKNDDTEKFKKRHLIKIADFENGILTMKIDEDMKEFYLKLNWYTKYQLQNIMQFKSTYSFRLYELLKQYENIGYRVISIDNLRIIFDINKDQYPKYANLKQKVINIAVNEINKNSDLSIEFEELKDGRKVISIKFIIKSNSNSKNETAITGATETEIKETNLIKQVQSIFYKHSITELEASKILKTAKNDVDIINQKYNIICQTNNIKNIVGATIQAIKEDWQGQKQNKPSTFNNFKQRDYDFEDLEKKLLGWE